MAYNERWLGLRSYSELDSSIFHGRTEEINEICNGIIHNNFTVLFGPSGTGKTSVIRAGVFPKLRQMHFLPVYIRFVHDCTISYPEQIYGAIRKSADEHGVDVTQTTNYIHDKCNSLWEYFHCNEFWGKDDYPVIPLIVIDQFEELFTLKNDNKIISDFFIELKDLCNDSCPHYIRAALEASRIPYPNRTTVRMVFSIREDFLARIEEYSKDIPALMHNRISLQLLKQKQALEIILGGGADIISHEVAIQIIQKVTGSSGFISIDDMPETEVDPAILSLFCNELDKKRISSGLSCITHEIVKEFGSNIISDFYYSVMQGVPATTVDILEDRLLTTDGFRDSMSLNDANHVGISDNDIDYLISSRIIRIEERMQTKRLEFSHDVLCGTAMKHKEYRKEAKAIEEEKVKYNKLKARSRRFYILSAFIFLTTAAAVFLYCFFYIWEYTEYYADVTWQDEYPIGINKLSEKDRHDRAHYMGFSKRGYKAKHWTSVRHLDHKGELRPTAESTFLINIDEHGEVNQRLAAKLRRCSTYEIISDSDESLVNQIRVYDDNDNLIYCYSINSHELSDGKLMYTIGQYTDSYGFPIESRKNGAQIVKITYDENGFRKLIEFYDAWGNKAESYNKAYGMAKEYSKESYSFGLLTKTYDIDMNGNILTDENGVCEQRYSYEKQDGILLLAEIQSLGAEGTVLCKERYKYDDRGNIVRVDLTDLSGNPPVDGVSCITRSFSNDNSLIEEIAYNAQSAPILGSCFLMEYDRNEEGDLITRRINLGNDLEPTNDETGICILESVTNMLGEVTQLTYYDVNRKQIGDRESFVYQDGLIIEYRRSSVQEDVNDDNFDLIRFEYDEKGNCITISHFETVESEIPSMVTHNNYDRQGNLMEIRRTDAKGNPLKGTSITRYTYDFWGNVTSVAVYCQDNITPDEIEGIHRIEKEYDERGRLTHSKYYNSHRRLIAEETNL